MGARFDLDRFVRAQAPVYAMALTELRSGRKRTHWMWYVFPQLHGLGHSVMAHRYGIVSLDEARAYLSHDLLGPRLRECTAAVLSHPDRTTEDIFGYPDDLKFWSSMTLFARAAEPSNLFEAALNAFCDGQPDPNTVQLLEEETDR